MASLMEATAALLQSKTPAGDLEQADFYMRQIDQMIEGTEVVIPRKYKHLAIVIETYAGDFPRFITYVKEIRDAVMIHDGQRSQRYNELQALSRRFDVRSAQHRRRERTALAVKWFEEQYPKVGFDQRHGWVRELERYWNRHRRAWMAAARKNAGGSLNLEQQADALEEFWASVDEDIENGDLPPYG